MPDTPLRRPRSRGAIPLATLLLAAAVLPAAPRRALAQWPAVTAGLPVCTAPGTQSLRAAISDGEGGMFVAWWDTRFIVSDVYVQHVLATGKVAWLTDGMLACGAANRQDQVVLVPDGAGGVVIAWRDFRADPDGDIYAQRLNANGQPQWTANGVAVCAVAGQQTTPVIAVDGSGASPTGVVVAWEDDRVAPRIYAQRLDPAGVASWSADGIPVSTSAAAQYEPAITAAVPYGTILAWSQQGVTGYDVVAGFLGLGGQRLWDPAGSLVSGAAGNQFHPAVVPDGAGGAWFTWEDDRGPSIGVYAQRVALPGFALLADGGAPVCDVNADQLSPVATADGRGGMIVAWSDTRVRSDIYAQRLDASGARRWAAGGQALCTVTGVHAFPSITSDGSGGALVVWEDERSGGGTDIYGQRADSLGTPLWTVGGAGLCTAASTQFQPIAVSSPDSFGVVVWVDLRGTNDLYAQRVPPATALALPAPAASPVVAAAGPELPAIAFSLAGDARAALSIADAAGRRVRTFGHAALVAGGHRVPWDGRDDVGRPCDAGVYTARVDVGGVAVATRSLTLAR